MKSTKSQTVRWLSHRIQRDRIDERTDAPIPMDYVFVVEGFSSHSPSFYISHEETGLNFGVLIDQEDGEEIVPSKISKRHLPWKELESLSKEERTAQLLNSLLAVIKARKKQYKTCRLCSRKFPPERQIDITTCGGCAQTMRLTL